MPHNEFVQKLINIIGPFYEYVNEDENGENSEESQDGEDDEEEEEKKCCRE